uniref:NADH-ubiquinone oxidoreductase chain 5 n=1 Tax=Namalycastis abiuma TaxID=862681 RepID=A0A342K7Z3_9ANNE|nr:NADH dehydrogenase subunit 5 [Namalycastis abiuma]AMY15512.1 NADH dehydrogenase subunit 5 [Namalycastis abiuma]
MVSTLSLSAGLSLIAAMTVKFTTKTFIIEWNLVPLLTTNINLPIIIDPEGALFVCVVLTIAASVIQFTKTYMKDEKFIKRFIILLMLFVMSMLFLIISPSMITLLLGWDGLGITSFVLVIYFQNPKSLGAGLITAFTNRIGDVMILLSIAMTIQQGHWFILNMDAYSVNTSIILCLLLASMTKSAQMPFSSWLPAAMAAPTPVSALVHSSTLVTAGVFLLYRFHPFLSSLPLFNHLLMIIATMTMLMAGASAMAECDMKKIIALSTLSQLGVMMFTLSMNLPQLTFFHLLTHALFKALLFICAGTLIHCHHHSQDLRSMGSTSNQMPMITTAMTIANLALCGMPFMAGFYSKDLIIESFMMLNYNMIIIIMFIAATILTTAYTTRFTLYVVLGPPQSSAIQYSTESQSEMNACYVLSSGAIMGGTIINWLLLSPLNEPILSLKMKLLPTFMMMTGLTMGALYYYSSHPLSRTLITSHNTMWFLTPFSTHIILPVPLQASLLQLKITDHGWNESPKLINFMSYTSINLITHMQPATITTHIMSSTLITALILMIL